MFTICPKCALTLLVTAEDLRVAQGYVRCGRCSSVFNALARLTEEEKPPEPAPGTAPQTRRQRSREEPAEEAGLEEAPPRETSSAGESRQAGAPAPPSPAPDMSDEDSIPEDALEFDPSRTDVTKVFVEPAPSPQWSEATGTFKAMIAANQEAMQSSEESARPRPPEPQPPARTEEPDSHAEPRRGTPPPASSAEDDDADIDVEIGLEQLASILRGDLAPVPPAAPSSLTGARAAPAPSEPKQAAATPPAPTPSGGAAATPPPSAPPPQPPRSRSVSATVKALRAKASAPPAQEEPPAHTPSVESHSPSPQPTPSPQPASSPPPALSLPPAPPSEPPRELPDEPSRTYARVLRIMRPGAAEQFEAYAWGAGALVMVLALLGQIVNHHRDELAASARFGRPLISLYSALGVRLMPHWDVKAYDVRQLGASVEPGGAGLITVRASVKNGAPQPQPLPLLRVTLQDRFGNRIAARDVAPRFYLSRNAPPFLSAGERIDAEMGFVDPGANAVGFEIDACLPTSGGAVTCANDVTAR